MKGKFLLASALFVLSTQVYALPANEVDTEFYDAQNNLIGETILTCSGNFYVFGTIQGYDHKEVYRTPCDFFGPVSSPEIVKSCTESFTSAEEQANCIDIKLSEQDKK